MDVFALVTHLEGLAVVPLALADIARHIDVRQEMHFHLDDTVALTGFTASAFDVEAESTRLVAARTRLLGAGKQFANRCENAGIGRRIRAWGAADRALVDVDALVDVFDTADSIQRARASSVVAPLSSVAAIG